MLSAQTLGPFKLLFCGGQKNCEFEASVGRHVVEVQGLAKWLDRFEQSLIDAICDSFKGCGLEFVRGS